MKKVLVCVGTRPNLIKITRLKECFSKYPDLQFKLLHTGQHFDYKMSKVFFEELEIPTPDVLFELKRDSVMTPIADIMLQFEKEIKNDRPDLVVVPGDVDSTFACAFVASRYNIPVAHIESGLRSFDKTMPEEINRIVVDDLAALFFTTEKSGNENLLKEGKKSENIIFTGNTMIDSLIKFKGKIEKSTVLQKHNLEKGKYLVMTFHRPANVDNEHNLKLIFQLISKISKDIKIIFPIHPRTIKNAENYGFKDLLSSSNIELCEPQGYFDFMNLITHAKGVVTDSGGIQEETTFLGVPCLTVRPNTERPITVGVGTNTLLELDEQVILNYVSSILSGQYKKGAIPEKWDGQSTERIVEAIHKFLN
ncbi:MAG: non-hydrolyzing UDP-N-acetylglucosamine 2-epimerase [Flavobacteriales bacterium]